MIKESMRIVLQGGITGRTPLSECIVSSEEKSMYAIIIMIFGKKNKYRWFYAFGTQYNILERVANILNSRNDKLLSKYDSYDHDFNNFETIEDAIANVKTRFIINDDGKSFSSLRDLQEYFNKIKELAIIS